MKIVLSILSVSLILIVYGEVQAASVAPEVSNLMQSGKNENIPVILRFCDRANINALNIDKRSERITRVINLLQEKSAQAQRAVRQRLQAVLDKQQQQTVRTLWMINAMAVTLPPRVIEELSRHKDIESITLDAEITPLISMWLPQLRRSGI